MKGLVTVTDGAGEGEGDDDGEGVCEDVAPPQTG